MAQKKRRPTARERRNGFIINILTLIVLVLLVFEGKSIISLFSHVDLKTRIQEEQEEVFASANLQVSESESVPEADTELTTSDQSESNNQTEPTKAAEPESEQRIETESEVSDKEEAVVSAAQNDPARTIGIPDGCEDYLSCIVPAQAQAMPDGYFSDAVFIGDSRMEGFHNFSGISGTNFVTAVGMQLENFYTDAQIATAAGNVTVLDALMATHFTKVYMMIGTNELGAYDMNTVRENYEKALNDIKRFASCEDPTVYVYSVIYVEEWLTEADYVNNANVDLVNAEILKMCSENGYHYVNLNEALSDGNGSLMSGVSEDGVHLNTEYCVEWLNYTKTHYIPSV